MNGHVTVIGGANMDINGFSRDPLNMEDSNPGRVEYCPGGVGRNIAENLHRLGADVKFISVIGSDPGGELIRTSSVRMGLNIEHSLFLGSGAHVTSVYIALMDSNGEMKLALADMGILDQMTMAHLESKAEIIGKSAIVVLDANLSEEIISFILSRSGSSEASGSAEPAGSTEPSGSAGPLFFLDAVSARKATRALPQIGKFDTLKMGRVEAEALSGVTLPSGEPEKLEEAAAWFAARGVRRIFITLGKEGVYAAEGSNGLFFPVQYVPPVNTSGGGDAFMAGIVYGTLRGWDRERIVAFSQACARITVQSKSAVSPKMNAELIERTMRT